MRSIFRFLTWLIVSVLIILGFYVLYMSWWNGVSWSGKSVTEVFQTAAVELKDKIVEKIKETSGNVINKAEDKVKESAKTYAEEKTAEVFSSLGEQLTNIAGSIGETNPSSTEKKQGDIRDAASLIVIKKNTPFHFLITSEVGASYSTTWGDEEGDEGLVSYDGTKAITHAWKKAGNYKVIIVTKKEGRAHAETFLIKVEE